MNKDFNSEKGFALVMVLLILMIFGVSVVAISSSMRTKGHVVTMVRNTGMALSRAEDGLAIAQAALQTGINIGSGFNISDNGWNIAVRYIDLGGGNFQLQSSANRADGRYSRTVVLNTVKTEISGGGQVPRIVLDSAIFTPGDIKVMHGTMNLRNDVPIHANGNIEIHHGVAGISNSTMEAGGVVNNYSNNKNPNQVVEVNGAEILEFPEINWNAFISAANRTVNSANITGSDLSSGGIIYVPVSSSQVTISGDITITSETTLVFVRTDNFAGDYKITIDTGNINGTSNQLDNGSYRRLNIFSDEGFIDFRPKANYNNPAGLIYTGSENKDIHVQGQGNVRCAVFADPKTNFKVGSVISRGDVYLKNANFDYAAIGPDWNIDGIDNEWDVGEPTYEYIFSNWREE